MRKLKNLLFGLAVVIGLTVGVSAQRSDDQKKPPPKQGDPPKVEPREKPPRGERPREDRPKKPEYGYIVLWRDEKRQLA